MQHSPGFLRLCEQARPAVVEIEPADVVSPVDNPGWTLIDVREDREWDAGHPPMAIHLGRGILERDIEARLPDPSTPIALLCGGGFRSALAAVSLQAMGYQRVVSVAGGVRAWQQAGLPWTP